MLRAARMILTCLIEFLLPLFLTLKLVRIYSDNLQPKAQPAIFNILYSATRIFAQVIKIILLSF